MGNKKSLWASMVAALMVAAAVTPASAAHAAPAAGSLHPGTALTIGNELCTAGFVARNQRGAPVMFTAGHCDVGERVQAQSAVGLVPAADFVASAYAGSDGEDPDIAVMKLTGAMDLNPAVDAELPVGGSVPIVAEGMTLCKQGAVTGRSCGPVIDASSSSKVKFAARIAPGDSGGPVWGYTTSGAIFAVGITIRQSSSDGYPVAELIEPWLDRWHLTID